ncbi:hypothetical protein BG005_010873 [Podila minutissima]|nr:hypothetical protein BG005_010873 [Podila minutissima]
MAPLSTPVDETPPGSPSIPITPYHAQYGQQHQMQQRYSCRAFGQSAVSGPIDTALILQQQQLLQQQQQQQGRSLQEQQYPSRTSSTRQTSNPRADTSGTSISSIHSYGSLNSNGGPRDIREGPSIISNSILNNSVIQIGNSTIGGGLNSNNSFFTVKQSNVTGSGTSSGSSPATSGSIVRPPMSSQSHAPSASTPSQSRKSRSKGDGHSQQRPSATVGPAPTPAMHWTRAKVHGQIPPKDLRAQSVNLVGESVYVFGGCDSKTCYNTLYIFDADTMHWTQPKTYGSIPPPCRAHSSTLVDNKRLYVFGGGDGPQYFNELYMLDTDTLTWTNPQTTGTRPCRRRAHTTCVYNNCMYVFGGGDGVQALNDTYMLNLTDMHWTELKTTGTIPISRGYHTSNLIKSQFIVYGGSDGHECFSDVHVLDLDTREWTKIDINRALPRLSHTSTQVGSYLFVVGGHDGSRYSCDVVMLNLVTWSWETRKVFGVPPAGRGYHASLLYDSRLFMFGGYDGQAVFDDIYILDLSTCAYLPQITDFQILLRRADPSSEDDDHDS